MSGVKVRRRSALRDARFVLAVAVLGAFGSVSRAAAQESPVREAPPEGEAVFEAESSERVEPITPGAIADPSVPPETDALRVAVLLLPTGDLDPATTDALTELLIAAIASRGATQIVGKEEIQALLGRDDASMLACMSSVTCLGVTGVELGVREIITGTLGRREGSWIFVIERIDVRSGDTAGRVFRVVEGELGALIDALSDAVPELYVETVRPGRIVLHTASVRGEIWLDGDLIGLSEAGLAYRRDLVPPGVHELAVTAPGYARWERTVEVEEGATLVLDAVLLPAERHLEVPPLTWVFGGASLATLGGAIALGVLSGAQPRGDATMRDTFEFFDAREREAIGANVLYAAAGAFLVAAVIPFVVRLIEGEPTRTLTIAPLLPSLAPSSWGALPRIDVGLRIEGTF
jgi:PEGA domain